MLILGLGSARLLTAPTAAGAASHSPVVITEFMAAGQTVLADEDGEYHDWIELHNRSVRSVNLLGWSLSDDEAVPDKWMLPNLDLPAGDYLVLFASGKDRPSFTNQPKEAPPQRLALPVSIHTNFKLAAESGTLALYDNTSRRYLDAVTYTYRQQSEAMSYGFCETFDGACYLATPTPGKPNDETIAWQGMVAPVTASMAHGFYDAPFSVTLATETPGATIWYTLDGSEPAEGRGQVYDGPLPVSATTVLRAIAVKEDYLAGTPATFSYIFPEQVLRQPGDPPGYPATWGTYRSGLLGYTRGAPGPADYGMDPEVVENPKYRDRMRDSLAALPSVSLVTGIDNLDIYFVDPLGQGLDSERPVSVEWLDPTGATPGFQIDAGLRLHGHLGRSELVPKHSFRLLFRESYGAAKLEYDIFPDSPVTSFDTLVLRAGNNESYAGYPNWKDRLATYAKDEWLRRSQLATSGAGAVGRFVHLYLNGLYWGLYNLVERPDASFAASYLGGDKEEWFSVKPGGADDGILGRLAAMRRLAELGGMADPARYATMLEYIDPVQFSDYMLLHWYVGAEDWPENNCLMVARQSGGTFQFFTWDGELTWKEGAEVKVGGDGKPDIFFPNIIKRLFSALILNPDFRMTLADRLYKQTSSGGALTDAEAQARWLAIGDELEEGILAESARWGDAWFDEPITQDDWRQGRDAVFAQMNGNAARLLEQARAQGYYPPFDPPAFSHESGSFAGSLRLEMTAGEGDVYYTMDGSDPRVQVTGAVSPTAQPYTGPIQLSRSTRVQARTLANGVWSALHEADFVATDQPVGLRITEIMYNPLGGDDYEFLKLTNVGGLEVDLSGATFEGIDLRFRYPTRLAGGSSLTLVADAAAFKKRYGEARITAEYGGTLADSGETITLRDAGGELLLSLAYDDENGWPLTADGRGDSLVLTDVAVDANDPVAWRASTVLHGTPGDGDGGTKGEGDAGLKARANSKAVDPITAQPSNVTGIRFGDDLLLAGYDVHLNGLPLATDGLPVLLPGDVLEYVLYWRGEQLTGKQAFIKLLMPTGELVAQADRAIGMVLRPLPDGSGSESVPERYTLEIPAAATVGLAQPVVHVYVPDTATRLPVFSAEGVKLGDDYALSPLKVAASGPAPAPQHPLHARFGEQIELLGYSLVAAGADLRAGQPLTVTFYFRTETPIGENLVRSVQLYSPELGMATQHDSQPAEGRNPTWAWAAGEVVADEVVLTLPPDILPGSYQLLLAIYEPAGGARFPVQDEDGRAAPDNILRVHDMVLSP